MRYALDVALENDKPSAALRAYYNAADLLPHSDQFQDAIALDRDGIALARRVGNRWWELSFLGHGYPLFSLGEWDEALELAKGLTEEDWKATRGAFLGYLMNAVLISVNRGEQDEAGRLIDVFSEMADSAEVQERMMYACSTAAVLLGAGTFQEALRSAEVALSGRQALGISHEGAKEAFVIAVEAALGANDLDKAQELLDVVGTLSPGNRTQFLDAQWTRFRARLDVRVGEAQHVEDRFKGAVGSLREISAVFHLAGTLLDFGTWLTAEGRADEAEPIFDEAREIFERLEARPWLERLEKVAPARVDSR